MDLITFASSRSAKVKDAWPILGRQRGKQEGRECSCLRPSKQFRSTARLETSGFPRFQIYQLLCWNSPKRVRAFRVSPGRMKPFSANLPCTFNFWQVLLLQAAEGPARAACKRPRAGLKAQIILSIYCLPLRTYTKSTMAKIIVFEGLPGGGKTTLSKDLGSYFDLTVVPENLFNADRTLKSSMLDPLATTEDIFMLKDRKTHV